MKAHWEREKIIWDSPYDSLTKLLLIALNSFVGGNGECWPSAKRLMAMTGMKRDSIIRKVKVLSADGVVTSSPRFDETGRQTSNAYRIDFDRLGRVAVSEGEGRCERGGRVAVSEGEGRCERGGRVAVSETELLKKELFIEPLQNELPLSPPENEARESACQFSAGKQPEQATAEDLASPPPIPRRPPRDVLAAAFEPPPPWRTGTGPNDWDEGFVEFIRCVLDAISPGKSRGDAIGYITKRGPTDHPEHPTLYARWMDYQSELARQPCEDSRRQEISPAQVRLQELNEKMAAEREKRREQLGY